MNSLSIDLRRHFACLFGAVLLVVVWRLASPAPLPFACYGALHASSVVLALRGPPKPWRAMAFGGLTVAVCELNYLTVLALNSTSMARNAGPYALVGASAGIGGLAYAALLGAFWLPQLRWRALVPIGGICLAGGVFAVSTARRVPLLGSWWLAVVWWLAFSGGLAWRTTVKADSVPAHLV